MPSERDDAARYGVTEDTDPAMLVGALGHGLDVERDSQPTDEHDGRSPEG